METYLNLHTFLASSLISLQSNNLCFVISIDCPKKNMVYILFLVSSSSNYYSTYSSKWLGSLNAPVRLLQLTWKAIAVTKAWAEGVMSVSCDCGDKLPQTDHLKQYKTILSVLEARSLESRWQEKKAPPMTFRQNLFPGFSTLQWLTCLPSLSLWSYCRFLCLRRFCALCLKEGMLLYLDPPT